VIKFDGNILSVINTVEMNKQGGLSVNFVPFRTIGAYISDIQYGIYLINILGNIIPFIPMGFIIPMAFPFKINLLKTMITCILLIVSIE
jgi:glycopeptide antibiotics resistance protein